MKKDTPSFRSPLGRVRALGSAKNGTHHWYVQRMTALAIIILSFYPVMGLIIYAVYGGRTAALAWLHSPFAAAGVILFLIVAFHHMVLGLQVVIEDYVHCSCAKSTMLFGIKFGSAAFAILGVLATLKIALGV